MMCYLWNLQKVRNRIELAVLHFFVLKSVGDDIVYNSCFRGALSFFYVFNGKDNEKPKENVENSMFSWKNR